jgi:N-acetylglucosaminyldiphosphoundecaprenol N-acetyl-beta-D-mannosaminyltransferase
MAAEALQLNASIDPRLVFGREIESERDRLDFAGSLIDRVDLTDAMGRIRAFLRNGAPHQIVTVNLDFLTIAQKDARFRDTINTSDLAVADGMPLVWLSRLRGRPLPQRVTGVELVDRCAALAAERHESVYLLGAGPGIGEAAARELQDRHPGLEIAGVHAPPFRPLTDDEDERIVESIRAAAPAFLFVAFGAPRQDLWIRTHLDRLGVPVAMGVGCVLDLLAGAVRRAPLWVQRGGLEWTYRLAHEPRRLWRRYVLDDMPMLGRLLFSSLHNDGDLERLPQRAEGAGS